MAIRSKKDLVEQQDIISVIRILTAITVLRLNETSGHLSEVKELLNRIDASLMRVFEIYPKGYSVYGKESKSQVRPSRLIKINKPLLVFISSNKELYGDLILDIAELFTNDMSKLDADGLVIGAVGKKLLEGKKFKGKVYFVDLDDDRPALPVIQQLSRLVESYVSVVVYHGITESIVHQIATKSSIKKIASDMGRPSKKYFFEPTVDDVLDYLQKQIQDNSFQQKLYEAHLARLSARRWNWMKQQLTRQKLLDDLTVEYRSYRRGLMSKQQQVAIFAHKLNISSDEILKNSKFYG